MSRERLALGDRVVDLGWGTLERGQLLERLSPSECAVLRAMAARPAEVVGRDELARAVGRELGDNALDRLMSRLRSRLEIDPHQPRYLHTVRGAGYRLAPSPAAVSTDRPAVATLIGREAELARLEASTEAVVVLTGPAGVGKTTLARALLARRDGWFVDLAPARTAGEVRAEVATALGASSTDPTRLVARLRSLEAPVVVLDNVEQCGEALAPLVSEWRAAAPRGRFVATSRRPLGLPDERRLAVGPLSPVDARALVRLRAAEVDPLAELDDAVVDRIVTRTDGLPLAIELAAAQLDRATPQALADRLDRSLGWLRDTASDRPERQSTLFRAIEGSWDLLAERERAALAAWSTVRGSFTLADAEALVPGALDPLQHLVDASLVRIVPGPRFVMPDAVREFGEARSADRADRDAQVAAWRAWCTAGAGTGTHSERNRNWAAALDAGLDLPDAPELATRLLRRSSSLPLARRIELAELADRATGVTRGWLLGLRCRVRRYAGLEGYRQDLDLAVALATELGDRELTDDVLSERSRIRTDDGDLVGAEADLLAATPTSAGRYLLANLYLGWSRPRSARRELEWVLAQPVRSLALRARMQLAVIGSADDPAAAHAALVQLHAELDRDDPGEDAIAPFALAWRATLSWELGERDRAADEAAAGVLDLRSRGWAVPATELDAMAAMFRTTIEDSRAHLDRIGPATGIVGSQVPLWRMVTESLRGDPERGAAAETEVRSTRRLVEGTTLGTTVALAAAARDGRSGRGWAALAALDAPAGEVAPSRATPQLRAIAEEIRGLR